MQAQAGMAAIKRFYGWWIRALGLALTPRRAEMRSWQVLLRRGPAGLAISARDGVGTKFLGLIETDAPPARIAAMRAEIRRGAGPQSRRVLLRLSADDVLERTIQIPRRALDVIGPVLRNQMERIVPWPEPETRYAYRLKGPSLLLPDQFDIQIAATRQSVLDQALAGAHRLGLAPYAIDYAADSDPDAGMVLLPLEADPAERMAARLQTLLAVLLGASLLVGGTGLWLLWGRYTESAAIQAQLAAVAAQLDEVKRLNQDSAELREQREQLVSRKREEPAAIVLIEALSRALPDNAYLTELDINGRETRIVGKSGNPTALITLLEATPQFEAVSFAAPTVREKNEVVETFAIVATGKGGQPLGRTP